LNQNYFIENALINYIHTLFIEELGAVYTNAQYV
jgi:hypothetical protein